MARTSAPRTTPRRRRRSPSASPTRPAAPSPSADWRCRTRAASASPAPPAPRRRRVAPTATVGKRLQAAIEAAGHASNWELVSAKESATGHPIAVMGPAGRLLRSADPPWRSTCTGPGSTLAAPPSPASASTSSSATGATTPGARRRRPPTTSTPSPRSSARTTSTTATAASAWRWKSWKRARAGRRTRPTRPPPGSQTLTAYRTVHGIVYARGKVGGKKVAFVRQRSTYFHEADSVVGFAQLNEPGVMTGPQGFKQAVSNINFLFNWSYVDSEHIAYALSGWMPQRAKGTSPDFPILGTGKYDWKGYKPEQPHRRLAAVRQTPAGGRPALPRLLEQQAGAGLGRGRRQVQLRAAVPLADDRRQGQGGDQGQEEDDDRPAGPGDGGTGDPGPARLPAAADDLQGDRQAEVGAAAERAGDAAAPGTKHGAHRRDLNRDGVYDENEAVAADGRLVAEAGRRASSSRSSAARPTRRWKGWCEPAATPAARRPNRTSPTAGGATSPRTCATSTGRSRRAPGAASTAAAARSRSAARCSSGRSRRR